MSCSKCGNSRLIRVNNFLQCVNCGTRYKLRNVIKVGITRREESDRVSEVAALLTFH